MCPSCRGGDLVWADHESDPEVLAVITPLGIAASHQVCVDCDWGTCGFD